MIIIKHKQKEFGKKIIKYLGDKSHKHEVIDPGLFNKILEIEGKNSGVGTVYTSDQKGVGYYSKHDNKIVVSENNASILAHELGHAYHDQNKNSKIGKILHSLDDKIENEYVTKAIPKVKGKDKNPDINLEQRKAIKKLAGKTKMIAGTGISGISGLAAGYKAEEEKEKGNKGKARLITAGSFLVPVLGHTPKVGREISATARGLSTLKKAGATKQQINSAKKSLGYALGTYLVKPAVDLAIHGGGQLAGRGLYKITHKNREENKSSEK